MKLLAPLFAALTLNLTLGLATPAAAQEQAVTYKVVKTTRTVTRVVQTAADRADAKAVARFGPFRVIEDGRAALVDSTDFHSPRHFAQLLEAFPGTRSLDLVDVPGTYDDVANLELGRMIRARGIDTHVPEDGSVRSGGVEVFLSGARRSAHPDAEFAVHAWIDDDGNEASDYAADAPEHRRYLSYYREMGMSDAAARAFYAMTNAASFADARWMTGAEMNRWTGSGEGTSRAALPAPLPAMPRASGAPLPPLPASPRPAKPSQIAYADLL